MSQHMFNQKDLEMAIDLYTTDAKKNGNIYIFLIMSYVIIDQQFSKTEDKSKYTALLINIREKFN